MELFKMHNFYTNFLRFRKPSLEFTSMYDCFFISKLSTYPTRILTARHYVANAFFNNGQLRYKSEGENFDSVNCKEILFLGSDNFSVQIFETVRSVFEFPESKISVIVSNEDNILGKHVKNLWNTKTDSTKIELITWSSFKDQIQRKPIQSDSSIKNFEFDLGVVASFGHLIASKIIKECKLGILNVHGSLLPRWRGAAPTSAAILAGDTMTGVTIMKIAPRRYDIGPVLSFREVPLDPHIRTPELNSLLASIGSEELENVLRNLNQFLITPICQKESDATKAPKLVAEIGHINWERLDAIEVYNIFRALSGRFKLKTSYMGHIVDLDDLAIYSSCSHDLSSSYINFYKYPAVISSQLSPDLSSQVYEPGQILFRHKLICVKCKNSDSIPSDLRLNWIFIRKLKISQKWISAIDFQNGWLSKAGALKRFDSISERTTARENEKLKV